MSSKRFGVKADLVTELLLQELLCREGQREEAANDNSASDNGTAEGDKDGSSQGEKNIKPAESADPVTVAQTSTTGDEDPDSHGSQTKARMQCSKHACRRRGPAACLHQMCFLCCFEVCQANNEVCESHRAMAEKRIEENKLMEQTLLGKAREKRLYHFREEKFTVTGQTVVIWCLHDFLANKKWNKEAFEVELRRRRQLNSLRKRAATRMRDDDELPDTHSPKKLGSSTSSDAAAGSAASRAGPDNKSSGPLGRRRAKERIAKLRKEWEKRLGVAGEASVI